MDVWPLYTAAAPAIPKRIQARRFRPLPTCSCGCGRPAIWVGRRSRWANRFRAGHRTVLSSASGRLSASIPLRPKDRQSAVNLYTEYIGDGVEVFPFGIMLANASVNHDVIRAELAGHDLACSCPVGTPCHGDVLLAIANSIVADDEPA